MSKSVPMPVPSASTRSFSSWFSSIFDSASDSVLRILPRSGRTACVRLSRPWLAVPPAESPSTMNSSHLLRVALTGSRAACRAGSCGGVPGDLRRTSLAASRLARRARAASTIRPMIASAIDGLPLSHVSSPGRTIPSTRPVSSGLLSRSLVCPWNMGSA